MNSSECKVGSLSDDVQFKVHVNKVKQLVESGEDRLINVSPSGLTIKLAFGSVKKGWLSLWFYAPANQTYFIKTLSATPDVPNKNSKYFPPKTLSDVCLEGLKGIGWNDFVIFGPWSLGPQFPQFTITIRVHFERRETSLPLETCCDPSLHNDMLEFFRNGDETDIVIVIEDSKIPAHKSILMKRSEYFRAMFESGLKESESKEVKIEADEKLFRILLEFWYSGRHPEDIKSVAWDLLEVAHLFRVQSIVDQCEFSIRAHLCVDQAIDALALADRLGCARLKKACLELIAKNLIEMRETEKFAELKKNPELFFELLKEMREKDIDLTNAMKVPDNVNKMAM